MPRRGTGYRLRVAVHLGTALALSGYAGASRAMLQDARRDRQIRYGAVTGLIFLATLSGTTIFFRSIPYAQVRLSLGSTLA
ncbi:hypothetical protein EDB83DRAFT_2524609 [Lactarius deliciosus]|nr:hypothetical protein EDB83DRAFT_2524609 [Lactarius deliciosus]